LIKKNGIKTVHKLTIQEHKLIFEKLYTNQWENTFWTLSRNNINVETIKKYVLHGKI